MISKVVRGSWSLSRQERQNLVLAWKLVPGVCPEFIHETLSSREQFKTLDLPRDRFLWNRFQCLYERLRTVRVFTARRDVWLRKRCLGRGPNLL